jgi:EmrB/QacA subfamily drug resistance transporter
LRNYTNVTSTPRSWRSGIVLAVASLGIFMVFLDTQVLFVAFNDIESSFPGVSSASLSWVLSGYTLVFAAALVPAGRLADRIGRKRLFLGALMLFTIASAACALAPNPQLLIVARVVQAVGAAGVTPTSLALVLRATPKERIPIAVAVWGSIGALAAALGPTLGGLLVDAWGWRSVFLINLPFGVAGVYLGRRVLEESMEADVGPFPDLVGSGILALGIGSVSLALVQSDTWGWLDVRTVAAIAAGILLVVAFVARSRRQAEPAIDLSLFQIPSFRWGNLAMAAFGLGFTAMFLANITFLTQVWGYGIVLAGMAMAPGPLVVVFLARPFGRLAARIGQRALLVPGALVYAAGGVLLIVGVGTTPDYWRAFLPSSLLAGLGVALTIPQLSSAAVQGLPADRLAVGSAVTQAIRQLGATFGVALVVSFIGGATASDALDRFHRAWWLLVICGILTSLLSLGLPRRVRETAGTVVLEGAPA